MSEMNEYQRGFQDGRQHGDLLIHGKARNAYDTLTKAGLGDEAGAMWAEIARLQAIVCSACEASMDAGRERDEAAEALTTERAAREAAERARAHLNAMYICALEDIERAEAECERLRSKVETLKELLGAAIRSGGEPAAQAVDALLASREDDA